MHFVCVWCGLCKNAEGWGNVSCTVASAFLQREGMLQRRVPALWTVQGHVKLMWEKYNLVPQYLIGSIAPPISFKLLILCNHIPVKISTATLNERAFFILVSGFRFARFNPQLTIKFSIRSIWPLISHYWLKNSNRSLKIPFSSIEPELNSRNWFLID